MRPLIRLMLVVASAVVLTSCSRAPKQAPFEELIVGKWQIDVGKAIITTVYKADHSFSGHIAPSDGNQPVSVNGVWQIDERIMTTTVTNSTAPHLIPVGHTSTDTLLSFSDTARTFDDGRTIITETRIE